MAASFRRVAGRRLLLRFPAAFHRLTGYLNTRKAACTSKSKVQAA